MNTTKTLITALFASALTAVSINDALAADYGPGVTDSEIKIGNTLPYSGPLSAYGTMGKTMEAYFKKINEEGGVHGRMIELESLDDGYVPTNTLSQVRRLVERDKVFMMVSVLGTPPNMAVREYLNRRKVPHLFGVTGQTALGDHENFPYTMGWQPSFQTEANIYVQHMLQENPDAKVAIIYQNGDYGKDFMTGMAEALGDRWDSVVVAEASFEATDPTIDTQMVTLQASGADTLFVVATPKFAAQAIRKAGQLDWHATQYVNNVANSVTSVMAPSGAVGDTETTYFTSFYSREPGDPQWADSPELLEFAEFMEKYYPEGEVTDNLNVYGYSVAQTVVQLISQMGDDLTQENAIKEVRNLDFTLPMLLPGIQIKTGETDYFPIEQLQLGRWNGESWELFGDVFSTSQGEE